MTMTRKDKYEKAYLSFLVIGCEYKCMSEPVYTHVPRAKVLVMSFSEKSPTDTDRNRNLGKISDRIPTDNIPSQNLTKI